MAGSFPAVSKQVEMTWFSGFWERYVSREEHQQVVDYYRKLVAQLYGNVRDLRALVEAQRARHSPDNGTARRSGNSLPKPPLSRPRYRSRKGTLDRM